MTAKYSDFDKKYEMHKQTVYNICFTYAKNQFDAEDLFQESFFDFFKLNKQFKDEKHEKYFLIRLTINNCKDFYRKKKRTPIRYENQLIENSATNDQNKDDIFELIEKLTDKLKEVVILKFVNNLGHKQIADILKIKEANVRKRLERAYQILNEEWSKKNDRT